jgi:transcriptional regulator with XRE-family HTH domain
MRDPVPPSRLRAARLMAGWKINDLAAVVGLSRWTLWRFETGLRQPTPTTRRALSDALGVNAGDLVEKAPPTR